jgi:hypothetical protein
MEAQLILAEAATNHPDGTVSMLRAGITNVWSDKPPYQLGGALVVRIAPSLADTGSHEFRLGFMDADGGQVIPPLSGRFEVGHGAGPVNLVMNLNCRLQKSGSYIFTFFVDQQELGSWTITCAAPPTQAPSF